mgnify:FL=1|tara:strand:+ start:53 stop:1741 length:1689 start_codon:yes stop_codon:yes gene_type:complete
MSAKVVPEETVAATALEITDLETIAGPECTPPARRQSHRPSILGAIHGLRGAKYTSNRSSLMIVEIVTGMSKAPDDVVLMGLRPDANRDDELAECKEQVTSKSKWHNACIVLRKFWLYFLLENLYAVFPLVMALVPVIAGGALANELITSMPMTAGKFNDFKDSTAEHTASVMALSYLQAAVTPIGLYGMPAALVCTLWSWKALLKPVLLKLLLPGFLVSLAFGLLNVSLLYRGTTVLEDYSLYFQILILALFLAPALVAAGKVARNPLFGWLAVPALVMCMGMVAGYNAFFVSLLTAPNWIKALFVSIINPVLFEIIVIWCRVLARSHRHNHPLTGVMTVAVAMTLKKMYGRYVAATITQTSYVTMCSVFLGLMEYLSVISVPKRDRFFYKKAGKIGQACFGLADTVDPTTQLKHERNTELRVHSAVMETSLEIVFTWTGVILVLMYNVSASGLAVDTSTVIANGAVQHGIEMLVDLLIILHLTVLQGEPYLKYANSRFLGWPLATGMLTFFASGYCVQATLPSLLCRIPGQHESSWIYCDGAFDAALLAYNATAALLPLT